MTPDRPPGGPGLRREGDAISTLLLLSNSPRAEADVLPSLGLLLHHLRVAPAQLPTVVDGPPADAVLVDGRRDLVAARNLCRLLHAAALGAPVLLVVTEGGLAAVTADWGLDDVVLDSAGPAEIEARLRLAAGRAAGTAGGERTSQIRNGDLVIDDASYTAHIGTRPMDLTFKEFELLKFLAQHPGRVFTRAHLLQEVWGFDFFGGTRTVDVHVRRLRAKLGVEYEHLIGTVRNVGYRFIAEPGAARIGVDDDGGPDDAGLGDRRPGDDRAEDDRAEDDRAEDDRAQEDAADEDVADLAGAHGSGPDDAGPGDGPRADRRTADRRTADRGVGDSRLGEFRGRAPRIGADPVSGRR